MTTGPDHRRFDVRLLDLLEADVTALADAELDLPTPSTGWTVRALLDHMSDEHARIIGVDRDDPDPRARFSALRQEWDDFFDTAPPAVQLPALGLTVPAERVLAVHGADMIVHRWDLCVAIGAPCDVDDTLLDIAHRVADGATAPGSALVGEESASYRPALELRPGADRLENLVRRYGRDPDGWPRA